MRYDELRKFTQRAAEDLYHRRSARAFYAEILEGDQTKPMYG